MNCSVEFPLPLTGQLGWLVSLVECDCHGCRSVGRGLCSPSRPCTSPRRNQCRSGGKPTPPQGWSASRDGWFQMPWSTDA